MFDAILSLVFLAAAIAIGCTLKKNTGLVSIALALILARLAGISDSWVIKSFNSSLFIMLLGVMFLFCLAQNNRTLEILARKAVLLCKGKVKLIPIVLFVLGAVISAIGPGLISTTALISVLAMALAIEIGVEPLSFLLFGAVGAFAGGLSPITPSGIVAITIAEENGITGIALPIAVIMFLVMLLVAAMLYFFVFRWHKFKESENSKAAEINDVKFKREHIFTLSGIVLVAVLSTVFSVNIGLAAIAVSVILCILGCAEESAAIKKIPWNTLLMITGVGMLISLVTELGGIDLLSTGISYLMGKHTAAAIITVLAGVMSWVSSASGVVMPTLIPTVPTLVSSLSGANPVALVTGICIGANAAAFSPLSSCGALMLSAYSTSEIATNEGRDKMFARLFYFSAACIGISAILALTGLFGIL